LKNLLLAAVLGFSVCSMAQISPGAGPNPHAAYLAMVGQLVAGKVMTRASWASGTYLIRYAPNPSIGVKMPLIDKVVAGVGSQYHPNFCPKIPKSSAPPCSDDTLATDWEVESPTPSAVKPSGNGIPGRPSISLPNNHSPQPVSIKN
jgi:hypothetical protein